MTELEACGFGFQIDHYHPKSLEGSDEYGNLYWSCEPCNRNKDNFWPAEDQRDRGVYVIRVDREDPRVHLAQDDRIGWLQHLTLTGQTNIELLYLNSSRLRRVREIRKRFAESDEYVVNGLRRLRDVRLDQLPRDLKLLALKVVAELSEAAKDVPELMSELARKHACSELLDPDPERGAQASARKTFLREQGALPTRRTRRRK
ncbi:MAG: HNH endonuclease [Kofleriaceae bacterium]|nr:HNH endonuclease [Myxococcales bacterium]MCB9563148.1 HNH endonuclease [Kofleriaceae bacterium]